MRDGMWRVLGLKLRTSQAAILRLERVSPIRKIPALEQQLLKVGDQMTAAKNKRLAELAAKVQTVAALMQAVSHKSVLDRGFTITCRADGGGIVRSVQDVGPAVRIMTQVRDGTIESTTDP